MACPDRDELRGLIGISAREMLQAGAVLYGLQLGFALLARYGIRPLEPAPDVEPQPSPEPSEPKSNA